MRAQNTSAVQEAKPSPSPRPYPVSIRSYKKRDHEYISTFNRAPRSDAELLQQRSDCDSDYSFIRVSAESGSSTSFASSTSSAGSYVRDAMTLMEVQNHHHHHHHLLNAQMSSDSAQMAEDRPESQIEVKEEKLVSIADLPSPAEESSAQVKAPVRSQVPQARARPRQAETQLAVLPIFGAWDTQNPSSGEAYTAIFKRLRDEKKSGGLPACASPTHSKSQGALESSSTESIAKKSHHSKSQVRKSSSRSIAKDASQHEGGHHRKYPLCTFCCKASVLDD